MSSRSIPARSRPASSSSRLAQPAGRAPDMSGPEVSSWKDLFRSYLAATHQRKLVVPVPVPGSKAVRNGALLPPPGHTEGVRTWDQFLAEELSGAPRRPRPRLTGQEGLETQLTPPTAYPHRPIIPARTILTQEGARSCKLA